MKNNQEIIQEIYRVRENMHKFDFCPSQKMTDFRILHSAADVYGVVILKDNKIYRAIKKGHEDYIKKLISSDMFQELVSRKWFENHFKKYFRLKYKEQYDTNRILFIGTLKKIKF